MTEHEEEGIRHHKPSPFRSHWRTVAPALRSRFLPVRVPSFREWTATLDDPDVGAITLTGKFTESKKWDKLCIILHGLAGDVDSHYCRLAAKTAEAKGYASLRLALRGSDHRGEDLHHAGLTADLQAALRCEQAQRYQHIDILAYSLGGHMALHAATEELPENVRSIAAVCPPLDLQACQRHVDRSLVYRWNLLTSLRASYRACIARGRAPEPVVDPRSIRTIYDWDAMAICKRYGFANPEDYYDTISIRDRYAATRRPLLILGSQDDPLVPFATVQEHLVDNNRVTTKFLPGEGHVFFASGVEEQVFDWFSTL